MCKRTSATIRLGLKTSAESMCDFTGMLIQVLHSSTANGTSTRSYKTEQDFTALNQAEARLENGHRSLLDSLSMRSVTSTKRPHCPVISQTCRSSHFTLHSRPARSPGSLSSSPLGPQIRTLSQSILVFRNASHRAFVFKHDRKRSLTSASV